MKSLAFYAKPFDALKGSLIGTPNMRIHPSKFPASLDARRETMLLVAPNDHAYKKLPKSFGIDAPKRAKSTRQTRGILRRIAERNAL